MAESDDTKGRRGAARGRGGESVEVAAVVDRVEEDTAVLSLGDGERTLDVPLSRLPEGTRDGDHLRLVFDGEPSARTLARAARDDDARADAEDRIKKMRDRLEARSGTAGKKDFKL
jgi:Protein of unknown function (DUF3006)